MNFRKFSRIFCILLFLHTFYASACLMLAIVDVERIFSPVNSIKTKRRNRLHTISCALLTVKENVKASGNCVIFFPPSGGKCHQTYFMQERHQILIE